MKKLCVRVGEDNRFGFKKGDLVWVRVGGDCHRTINHVV